MTHIIFAFVLFLCGILFFIIRLAAFKMQIPNIIHVLLFIITFIPFFGLLLNLGLLIVNICTYQKKSFYMTDVVQVRDTKLNRWLFEDVHWDEYNKYKNKYTNI